MPSSIESLSWIALCAVIAPLLAGIVPRRLVPEVVLLLAAGILIGPHAFDLAATDEAIGMLRELGLSMLFLLAGYEIEPRELTGRAGRRALLTWLFCLGVALVVTNLLEYAGVIDSEIAVAIALTSTALGTLLPILKDNGLLSSPVGATVMRHGAFGELGPIVAIAVLLGVRGPLVSIIVLIVFAAICVLVSLPSARLRHETSQLLELIRMGSETTGQTAVRLTILLLVALSAVAAAFELDTVLAAFAAGFILRLSLPSGNERLETKIEGLAFGFLIPVFFITSGMAIDPEAIAEHPDDFAVVLLLILLIRGGPVFVVSRYLPSRGDRAFDTPQSSGVSLFAATGLPIIVAVTSVAVDKGQMTSANASVLVGAGAVTVLLFPMLATLILQRRQEAPAATRAHPPDAR
jgi:Kef-type K+ transport system membrane component KefB